MLTKTRVRAFLVLVSSSTVLFAVQLADANNEDDRSLEKAIDVFNNGIKQVQEQHGTDSSWYALSGLWRYGLVSSL